MASQPSIATALKPMLAKTPPGQATEPLKIPNEMMAQPMLQHPREVAAWPSGMNSYFHILNVLLIDAVTYALVSPNSETD